MEFACSLCIFEGFSLGGNLPGEDIQTKVENMQTKHKKALDPAGVELRPFNIGL